jgi:hypothetical protein
VFSLFTNTFGQTLPFPKLPEHGYKQPIKHKLRKHAEEHFPDCKLKIQLSCINLAEVLGES